MLWVEPGNQLGDARLVNVPLHGTDHCRRATRDATPLEGAHIMARRRTNNFARNDLKRAIRGAQEMGLSVDSFEIGRDGKIVVHTRKGEPGEPSNDLDNWLKKKDARQA
jgi:hypothetical protein